MVMEKKISSRKSQDNLKRLNWFYTVIRAGHIIFFFLFGGELANGVNNNQKNGVYLQSLNI